MPPPLSAAAFSSGDWTNNTRQGVFNETHIFSPRVINEFRAGYTRLRTERLQFNSSEDLSSQIGIPGIPFAPCNGGLPRFSVSGVSTFGSATYQPTREFENVCHFIETISRHQRQVTHSSSAPSGSRSSTSASSSRPRRAARSALTATIRATRTTATTRAWASPISLSAFRRAPRLLPSSTTRSSSPGISSTCRTMLK